jgi:hypothetical protein
MEEVGERERTLVMNGRFALGDEGEVLVGGELGDTEEDLPDRRTEGGPTTCLMRRESRKGEKGRGGGGSAAGVFGRL